QHTELESGVNIQYHIKSIRLEDARQVNIINYDWNPKILEYSQYNLAVGKGQEISYDLSKIEAELVQNLVLNKTYLERIEPGGLLLEPFSYCMEMFQGSTTILYDIKQKIKQEPIPQDKILLLTSGVSQNQHSEFISSTRNAEMIFSDNESELLSALELLLCFIKRTTDIDADMTLKSYIQQWVKLSVLTENKILEKVLKTDLQLKHAIALYELVEEKVADIMIESIATKYKAQITKEIEDDIMVACTFGQKDVKPNSNLIPADVFMRALKRFMYRQLLVETIQENLPLSVYMTETTTICCWPDNIDEDLISDLFPMSLLIKHTYAAYHFIKNKIEVAATEKQNIMKQPNLLKEEQDQRFKK
ncbi:28726_t:CDS:2, partial [Dentiscutata erythropus]